MIFIYSSILYYNSIFYIGRELFKRWGYKRCEDIVWAKTNKDNIGKFNFRPKNND